MEEDLLTILRNAPAITALTDDRIEFGLMAQGTDMPAIALRVVTQADTYGLNTEAGLQRSRVQVDCFGESYSDSKALSRQVRSVLSGYRSGAMQGVFHINSIDLNEKGNNEVRPLFRTSMDFEIVYAVGG